MSFRMNRRSGAPVRSAGGDADQGLEQQEPTLAAVVPAQILVGDRVARQEPEVVGRHVGDDRDHQVDAAAIGGDDLGEEVADVRVDPVAASAGDRPWIEVEGEHPGVRAVMGQVGAVLVAVWAKGLIVETGKVLLDREMDHPVVGEIREVIDGREASHGLRLTDLHVWRVGRGSWACALTLVTTDPALTADTVRQWLAVHEEIVHVTVELQRG